MNIVGDEVPPPGAGFTTVTVADPMFAISAAGIYATSCEELINAVAIKPSFHSTMAFGPNPEPFNLISKSAPPWAVLEGDSEEREGVGLLGPVIAKLSEGVAITWLGILTATLAVPAVAISSPVRSIS